MKKITYILMTLIIVVVLAGCLGNDEKDAAFKKCLDETKPLNAETIDSMFTENAPIEMPNDVFSPVVIDNTKISIESGETKNEVYVWQEDSKIYVNAPSYDSTTSTETTESLYLDLAQLEAMYDEYVAQASLSENVKPSELYEKMIQEHSTDLGLEGTILESRSLDELLEIFNYKYSDFKKVEDGKYAVKNEVLYAKLLKWIAQDITVEQFIEMLTESNVEMNLYAYFDGTSINAYEVVIKNTSEGETVEIKAKLSFLYNEEELNGIKVELNLSGQLVSLEIKVVESSLVAELIVDVPSIQKMVISLKVSSESLEFSIENNDVIICNVDLEYGIVQEQNKTKIYLSGSINYEGDTVTITQGSDIVIPSERLATKDTATNLLEAASVN